MSKKKGQNVFVRNALRLREITPLTVNQKKLFDTHAKGGQLFVHGCPGTGKSFLSIYLALTELMKDDCPFRRIIILRSTVPARDQGFLPGTAEEKSAIYETPYQAIFTELFNRPDAYDLLKEEGTVEFVTTSFLRGMSFKDSIIIVDEMQNLTFEELNTVISRVGDNSKVMFLGDYYQTDLNKKRNDVSGYVKFKSILETIDEFSFVQMDIEDIVRSLIVKKYIIARIKYEEVHEAFDPA
jgi:phosphate starvation-inducible protein PhoH and related proteins